MRAPERRPLRVLHLLGTARPGGVETYVLNMARFADRSRCALHVCVASGPGPIADELRDLSVPVVLLGNGSKARQLWRLHRYAWKHDFDLLHANLGGRALRWAVRLAARPPELLHLHAQPGGLSVDDPAALPSLRRITRGAFRVCVCSRWLASWVGSVMPELKATVHVQHYGIDLEKYGDGAIAAGRLLRARLGVADDAVVVGFVGRLVEQKGVTQLVEIVRRLLEERTSIHVVIAGDGPLRAEFARLVSSARERLHMLGARRDVPAVMNAMDVLVVTSRWEPLGIVAMEAMAAGKPVAAFAVGGLPEVVADGTTGLLVAAEDVAALTKTVLRLTDDAELRMSLGARGRRRVEDCFRGEAMAEAFVELYEHMAHRGSTSITASPRN